MQFKRIKNLREDNDLSQEDIAKILKITRQQYGLYETGKRTIPIDLIMTIAKFYKTSIDYITELTNIKEPYPRKK